MDCLCGLLLQSLRISSVHGGDVRLNEEASLFADHDLNRLGPSAYYQHIFAGGEDQQVLSNGVGLFFGMNDNTPDYTFKWSVEFEF